MRNSLRKLALAACAAVALSSGLAVTSAAAATSAPAHMSIHVRPDCVVNPATGRCAGLDHTDPYATGCAGPGASYYVVATTPIYKGSTSVQAGYVQLWYSSTCGTNWARTVVFNDGLNDIFYVKTGVSTADGRVDTYDRYPGTSWTNQLSAPTVKARACGEIAAGSFSTAYTCTGWF